MKQGKILRRARREKVHSNLMYIIVGRIAREFVLSTFQRLAEPGKVCPASRTQIGRSCLKIIQKRDGEETKKARVLTGLFEF